MFQVAGILFVRLRVEVIPSVEWGIAAKCIARAMFALETFWPSTDGWSAARIEEEIVVTETGHEVITRFPADKLLVAGAHYVTVDGPLPRTREHESPPSQHVKDMIAMSAIQEQVSTKK